MGTRVLGIDSSYDRVTADFYAYRRKHVYPFLEKSGFRVHCLGGPRCRRDYVSRAAKSPTVRYLTGSGHGLFDRLRAHVGPPVLQAAATDPRIARGKIVHLLACETADRLGPTLVAGGCRAFFGYTRTFAYPFDDAGRKELKVFLACDSLVDLLLAQGVAAGEVFERVCEAYTTAIRQFERDGREFLASRLRHNRDHFRGPGVGNEYGKRGVRLRGRAA